MKGEKKKKKKKKKKKNRAVNRQWNVTQRGIEGKKEIKAKRNWGRKR